MVTFTFTAERFSAWARLLVLIESSTSGRARGVPVTLRVPLMPWPWTEQKNGYDPAGTNCVPLTGVVPELIVALLNSGPPPGAGEFAVTSCEPEPPAQVMVAIVPPSW